MMSTLIDLPKNQYKPMGVLGRRFKKMITEHNSYLMQLLFNIMFSKEV